ncbi:hypothetical protein [Bacillus sp. ISL-39]|uniref:hypothetical protein n=1 Tax=Bacillus sp. ISL-39 TaxID=2819124 RepID=UPI001BE64291|nr:hypothetical protein [Bacillus sp. ISL-39]
MRKTKITLLFLSLLTLLLFFIMNRMTVSPGTTSGNGNPALLIALTLFPIFFLLVILWVRVLNFYIFQIKFLIAGMVVIVIHLIVAFIYQKNELVDYQEVIKNALIAKDGFVDSQYLHDITSGLSIHVNNQYFNLNTFFMFITLSVLVALFYSTLTRLEERMNNKKQ